MNQINLESGIEIGILLAISEENQKLADHFERCKTCKTNLDVLVSQISGKKFNESQHIKNGKNMLKIASNHCQT